MEIRAKKSLGQNFLEDTNILDKIVSSVTVSENDLIIEIGPGKGALTKRLKKYNCDVIAFEIDTRLKDILESLKDDKTNIVFEDFLNIKLNEYINKDYSNIHVIANIPYYITNPIIKKLLESNIKIKDITLMVQKEVAERLSASPKSKAYGSLTIYCNTFYNVKKVFDVSKYCFNPVPKVDSSIVQFQEKEDKYLINDYSKFEKLVNDSFSQKRKTLRNNLKNYNWSLIEEELKKLGYTDKVRAEELPIEVFVTLSNKM